MKIGDEVYIIDEPKTEPQCEACINYGVEFTDDDSFDTCLANECHYEPKTEPQVRSNLELLGVDEPRTVPLYPMTKGERVDGNQSTRIEDNKGLC